MPTFDLDIDVDEFMDNLSSNEIKEVIEWLEENDELEGYLIDKKASGLESFFNDMLRRLSVNYYVLTAEEQQVIESIASKFPKP